MSRISHAPRSALLAIGLAVSVACTGETDTAPEDTDEVAESARIDLSGYWTSTSDPSRGWWDFPWQDPDTWCSSLRVTVGDFQTEAGEPFDCWDGEPLDCYQNALFESSGDVVWLVSAVVVPCDGSEDDALRVGAQVDLDGEWAFLRREGANDVFQVFSQEWEMEEVDHWKYEVRADDRAYEMVKQSAEE